MRPLRSLSVGRRGLWRRIVLLCVVLCSLMPWRPARALELAALVKDINPTITNLGSSPTSLTVVGDVVYFVADDGSNGRELWRSDGPPAGTVLVKDIYPGQPDSFPD